jgi:hypothetical protein
VIARDRAWTMSAIGEVTGIRPLVEIVNDLAGLRGDEPPEEARDRIAAIVAGEAGALTWQPDRAGGRPH